MTISAQPNALIRRSQSKSNRDINLAAAEQIIFEKIKSAGFLQLPVMSEPSSEVIVADMIILEDLE